MKINSEELLSHKCDAYIWTFCHVNDETRSLFFIRKITSSKTSCFITSICSNLRYLKNVLKIKVTFLQKIIFFTQRNGWWKVFMSDGSLNYIGKKRHFWVSGFSLNATRKRSFWTQQPSGYVFFAAVFLKPLYCGNLLWQPLSRRLCK